MVLIVFENVENFSLGAFNHLSKMSLQGTIFPGRLRSELCPWGVKVFDIGQNGSGLGHIPDAKWCFIIMIG